jgi:DNA-binding NarL/FixJ family response regulator
MKRTGGVLLRITARRAEVLREIADGYSEREIAGHLGLELSGVRSHTEQLRDLVGCSTVRELGRWWRSHRREWVAAMCEQAGVAFLGPVIGAPSRISSAAR